jgi:signal transduction histidine kinase
MMFKSIRWRLQIWYGLVFLAVLTGFGLTAYELERNRQLRNIDAEFQKRLGALDGAMRPPPRQMGGRGGPGGGPPGDFPGDGPPQDPGGGLRNGFPDGGPPDDRRGGPGNGFPDEGPPEGRAGGRGDDRPFRFPGGLGTFLMQRASNLTNLFGAEPDAFYYVIWDRDGNELAKSEAAPGDVPWLEGKPGDPPPPPRMRGFLRELSHPTPGGEIVLVGRSIAEDLAGLCVVGWSLAGAGVVVLLLGLTGGWWIASRALRPVEEISATAVKIAAGDLSQRISAAEADSELGRLAAVLNSTFSRLEASFAQQRQFTADAAHELRTPIAVMLTQTQTVLTRDRAAPEYRAAVEACQRAAQRMRALMESLLQLARLDAGQETMRRMPFDLSKLVADCAEQLAPLAEARRVKILSSVPPTPCLGDPDRMSQVLTNLLANAIEYNKENGEVHITAEPQIGVVSLTVADTGEGIAPEDLPRVFERFYRADKSRTGGGGHTGLGLAISRAIVQAHGGDITVTSPPGSGAIFTVTLPLPPSSPS